MRAIDAWVNVALGPPTEWQLQVAEQYFRRPASEVFRDVDLTELIAMMDAQNVVKAIVTVQGATPAPQVIAMIDRAPDRLALAVTIDPRRGMQAIRELVALHRDHPVVAARVLPCTIDLAPCDRAYYPLYAKCVELDLPISINAGIPGPPLPGKCQDVMHFDDVCLFFPDLTLIMANGADPWWSVAIRLMLKYPNLYLMTSAYAPKYLPAELLQYMNTRGQDKVMFATDFPFLTMERCLREASALDLRDGVLDKYLYANAERVFWGRRG